MKALVFDTFGTVVDWRGSIIREGGVAGRVLPGRAAREPAVREPAAGVGSGQGKPAICRQR